MSLSSIELPIFCDELELSANPNNLDTIANTTTTANIPHQIAFAANQISVRPVREEEINCVADIITHSFHFDRGWRGWFTPLFKLGIAEDLRHRLRANGPTTYRSQTQQQVCSIAVYREQGQTHIIGTVEVGIRTNHALTQNRRYAYISNLAVSNNFRRRGAGLELLKDCEQVTKAWGYSELYLHVMADNDSGRNLYQRSGYEVVSTEFVWSIIPWHRPQRLFLRKQLS
jgi:ribosomal protein S18 acetylase RimI-like enzyme